jgi:hypothetical protein
MITHTTPVVGEAPVTSVAFDKSGVFLAIGGGGASGMDVQVKVVKDWSQSVVSLLLHKLCTVSIPSPVYEESNPSCYVLIVPSPLPPSLLLLGLAGWLTRWLAGCGASARQL